MLLNDPDPVETQEWLDAMRSVVQYQGVERMQYLLGKLQQPFVVLDQVNKFDVTVKVAGGGHPGQAEAIRLGIAKAFVELNEDYKSTLKRADLLSRDSREKERKKFGLKGARKQRQFTKR